MTMNTTQISRTSLIHKVLWVIFTGWTWLLLLYKSIPHKWIGQWSIQNKDNIAPALNQFAGAARRAVRLKSVLIHLEQVWQDNMRRQPRFAFIPFVGGPCQCIRQDFTQDVAAVVLTMTAQRFDLLLTFEAKMKRSLFVTLRSGVMHVGFKEGTI